MSLQAKQTKKPKTIDNFSGLYFFLSNFYIEPDGSHVEGEYQMMKCARVEDWKLFKGLSPGMAKRMGRTVEIWKDWEEVKDSVMYDCLTLKFTDHPQLAKMLLATGDAELIEGNVWKDTYWGVCEGVGQNVLGRLLMMVRDNLRSDT